MYYILMVLLIFRRHNTKLTMEQFLKKAELPEFEVIIKSAKQATVEVPDGDVGDLIDALEAHGFNYDLED